MERAYPIIMFLFAGGLLIYAGLVGLGNPGMIRRFYAARPKNVSRYTRKFAVVLALTAAAPLMSGVVGLVTDMNSQPMPAVAVLIVGFVVMLIVGIRVTKIRDEL